METSQIKKITLNIHGMHCASCEILVEQKFKKVAGIKKVRVNHTAGKADLECSRDPNIAELNDMVKEYGYTVSLRDRKNNEIHGGAGKNTPVDYLQMSYIFLVILSLYYLLKRFDFLPSFSISEHMSYGLIFLIGIFAAVSSCIAVVGGLLLSLAGRYNEAHPDLSGIQKFKPHAYFNIGRIVGYTVFGALVGALGSVIALSPRFNGYLMIVVSVVMLLLGFQLLHLFPELRRFSPKMPKFISYKIHDLSTIESKGRPFSLGALTFFLPCGFTQALQLYVLAIGDWKVGALTMLVFSLGTMPALVSISAASSFARGEFQKHFLRFAGVLIVMLSTFNINNGLVLAGFDTNFLPTFAAGSTNTGQTVAPKTEIVNGKQIVKMTVSGYSYSPSRFTIVEGIPVEWQIDGTGAAGCGRVLVMPSLGMSKYLSTEGITVVTFTPTQTGAIPFNCSMGMMTRGSEFIVVPNTTGISGAKVDSSASTPVSACDSTVSKCPEVQKLSIEVSEERGIFPRSLTAKKGTLIELTIDDKIPLGGCASVWVIPKYNITIPMNGTVSKNTFLPEESGIINITCSMGSKLAEIIVID